MKHFLSQFHEIILFLNKTFKLWFYFTCLFRQIRYCCCFQVKLLSHWFLQVYMYFYGPGAVECSHVNSFFQVTLQFCIFYFVRDRNFGIFIIPVHPHPISIDRPSVLPRKPSYLLSGFIVTRVYLLLWQFISWKCLLP